MPYRRCRAPLITLLRVVSQIINKKKHFTFTRSGFVHSHPFRCTRYFYITISVQITVLYPLLIVYNNNTVQVRSCVFFVWIRCSQAAYKRAIWLQCVMHINYNISLGTLSFFFFFRPTIILSHFAVQSFPRPLHAYSFQFAKTAITDRYHSYQYIIPCCH